MASTDSLPGRLQSDCIDTRNGDWPLQLLLAYLAGILTLINPCVLPVLPIVLASSLHRDRLAPVALAAGLSLSFVALGLGVTAIGPALGLDSDTVSRGAALVMIAFGLVMLVPAFKLFRTHDRTDARKLMFSSFIYLPLVQLAYVLDRIL